MAEPEADQGMFFNHVGVCVTDLERSRRFYEEVLGFRFWYELDAGDEGTGKLLRIPPPVGLKAAYLVHGQLVLELLLFAEAGTHPGEERVMNEPGLTHLSLAAADIPGVLAEVESHGGEILADTDIGGLAVMIRDPDGQLIELTSLGFRDSRPAWPG